MKKDRIKKWYDEKDIFFSGVIVGLLAHMYMLTNKLPNIDDYISIFHYGGGYTSGRWLLALIGNFSFRVDGTYSLPFFNGIVFVLCLSASIVLFLKPFQLEGRLIKRVLAGLFVVFPSVTATMGFMFTTPFYGLAVVFMAIAFYILVMYRWGFLVSMILICCSMGIYQAYWGLVAGFLLLYLISVCIKANTQKDVLVILALKSLGSLFLGVIMYLQVNTWMLTWQGVSMSTYQGLNKMGEFSINKIPTILAQAYGSFISLFTENYMYITWYPFIRVAIGLGYGISCALLIWRLWNNRKQILKCVALVCFFIIFPLTINSIYIMCNDASAVHTLMCYSVVLVFFLPFVVMDAENLHGRSERIVKMVEKVYLYIVMVVVLVYVRFANIYYLNLELSFHEIAGFMGTLSTRIQEIEGYSVEKPILFYGAYSQDVNKNIWEMRMVNHMVGSVDVANVINSPMLRQSFSRVYMGNRFNETVDISQMEGIFSFIEEMPYYPDDGSIKEMGEIIVVKLSD